MIRSEETYVIYELPSKLTMFLIIVVPKKEEWDEGRKFI